ncbi:MAG: carbohydrate ABC transporter permease [candidate division KSB1 bacterium]|nr:carbohydrate ABC transporter permease [candidate division KSB1 bacterium]
MIHWPRWRKRLAVAALHLLAFLLALWACVPFVWMLSASTMPAGEASQFPPRLFPSSPTLAHYSTLLDRLSLARYFLNSLVLAIGVSLASLLVNSMAGYAFSKLAFPGRRPLFTVLLSTMIIPGQVTMLPVFLLLKHLHLLNSYLGIILPGMASVFAVYLVKQYFDALPDSLLEAARLDGAGDWAIYWRIMLPLSRPILATLGLFTFVGTWNDFLWPLIVMTREDMYTLPVALATLMGEHAQDVELMMAGCVLTVLPIVIVFLLLQRHYLRGILIGGLRE